MNFEKDDDVFSCYNKKEGKNMNDKLRGVNIIFFISIIILCLTGCSTYEEQHVNNSELKTELFDEESNSLGNIQAPIGFNWRQCEGVVLDFIVENNINANILSKESEKFTEVTGVKVNVRSMEFTTLTEKINMEFISKTDQYELIYVDPYQTLTRFSDSLEDLYLYERDKDLPHIVGGIEQFTKEQLQVCSYFENEEKLYSIPFDSTNMIMFYRKDIFDKYSAEMEKELGYKPLPGTLDFTWERYLEVSAWISSNVPKQEVKYGSLTMSARHNSVYTEFSTILAAYGGDYFDYNQISMMGTEKLEALSKNKESFQQALSIYKQLVELNPSEVRGWNWTEINEAFQNGDVAMMANWDENAAAVENPVYSKVGGKVGYAVLPYGSDRSANIYGGSGIGINTYSSEEKKLASWMFIVWATSPNMQTKILLEEGGGNMPTRKDIYRLIESQYMAALPHASATIRAQKPAYAYYRPKMKNAYDFENLIIQNLENMLSNGTEPEAVYQNIKKRWDDIIKERDSR